jgi:succinate dehydrogenase / fumarate reductase flavoprotein subunit
MSILDAKVPAGPIEKKWSEHKDHIRLVNPANKRRIDIIVVGTPGLRAHPRHRPLRRWATT